MATVPSSTVFYSDFDFRFIGHPHTGRLIMRKNADSITQAIKLLIMTDQFERPFRPFLGSAVRQSLFDQFSGMTIDNIEESIIMAINNIETRATDVEVFTAVDPDSNQLDIKIVYRPVNATNAVEVNFTLERLR